jgi:hypothetical protein
MSPYSPYRLKNYAYDENLCWTICMCIHYLLKLRFSFFGRTRQVIGECSITGYNATLSKDFFYSQENFSTEHAIEVHTATHRQR